VTTRTLRASAAAPRKVTINDVALAAGVGRQTVSNVLNGTGRVGTEARARVLQVVAELGYHPHHGARSLRTSRTMRLGYLMTEIQLEPSNLIMLQFLQSLVAAAARHHYRVVVAHDVDLGEEIRQLIAGRSVDAFVLSDIQPGDPRAELLCELGVPFASFGRTSPGLPQHWVDFDNAGGVAAAVRHVLGQGFTRPGYVGYAPRTYWDAEREDGFRAGLDVAGGGAGGGAGAGAGGGAGADGSAAGAGVLHIDDDESAPAAIRAFISSARPDAVITGSDKIAAMVYNVAAELDLRVGRDLAVTGFDGSMRAELLHPQLTTVAIPVDDIAERVIGRVLRQLDQGQDSEPGEIVPTPLRVAGSTAARS